MTALSTKRVQPVRIDRGAQSLPTHRELEILELAGRGLSMKSIARELNISPGTVSWHLKNLYCKLGAGSREEALRKARIGRLIETVQVCPICSGSMVMRH